MSNGTCIVEGCETPPRTRQMCGKHYHRWQRYGTTAPRRESADLTPRQRLDRWLDKTGTCWVWTHSTSRGYGKLTLGGKSWYAHRLAYVLAFGPIPDGVEIDHRCRNRACCNPEHLRLATHKQNAENVGPSARSTTGVRGVYRRRDGIYYVQVMHHRETHSGGTFVDLADAEAAAIDLRNRLHTHNEDDRVA